MVDFESNVKLVPYIYNRKFYRYNYIKDDLMQAGYMGLWRACINFKEDFNIKFATYAYRCISNEMNSVLRKELKHDINICKVDIFDNINIAEVAEDKRYNINIIDFKIDIKNDINKQNINEKVAFVMWNSGYSQEYISEKLNKPRCNINKKLRKIKEDINRNNEKF